MTTPPRATSRSPSPRAPPPPAGHPPSTSSPPGRARASAATTSTARSLPRPGSPHPAAARGRHGASRGGLRGQTPTGSSRGAGSSSSTPRARLAGGGPPRVAARERPRRPPPPPPDRPPALVRYHWSTITILVLYLPLLIVPWVIVCILDVKPLTWHGTSYQTSGWYTPNDVAWVPRWVRASNMLACCSAALAYPVVTAVLSHASVAFVQNVRAGQEISTRDLLALADGCWMRMNGDRRTRLANVGSTLLVLGMITPLLQISAVRIEEVRIATCNDVPRPKNNDQACHKPRSFGYTVGGYDPEPADMAFAPGNLVARRVRSRLPLLSNLESLDHIWPNTAGAGDNWALELGNTFYYYQKTSITPIPFYVSNFPPTFNTGVLREHALRFNSTASCSAVPRSSFPDVCPGPSPLSGQFSNDETQNRFCVPGNATSTPWTADRKRQDISEELWVDNHIPYGSLVTNASAFGFPAVNNLTVHCVARTTRGYFELPNNHNDGKAGPLLRDWPSQAVLEADFNDVEAGASSEPPAESNPHNKSEILLFRYGADPFDRHNQTTPGPLAVLVNAMLGEESWFYPVANATSTQEVRDSLVSACTRGLPFATYSGVLRNGFSHANLGCSLLGGAPRPPDGQAAGAAGRLVAEWFSGFGYNASTEDALEAGLYLAGEALLALTADASRGGGARPVHASGGTAALRPRVRAPAKAVVSLLVTAEAAGLLALAWACYRVPTFASRLDAVHVAAIGAQLAGAGAEERRLLLPPLGLPRRGVARLRYLRRLEGADGRIGVEEEGEEVEMARLRRGGVAHAQPQGQGPPAAASSRPSSVHGAQLERLGGSHGGVSLTSRPPRVHSYASSSHTNDDAISALGAVSEGNGPDGPPKYEDVVQASVERAASTATAAQRSRLVVGGSGKISRDMAKVSTTPTRRRTTYSARGSRSNRSSAVGIQDNFGSSRTA